MPATAKKTGIVRTVRKVAPKAKSVRPKAKPVRSTAAKSRAAPKRAATKTKAKVNPKARGRPKRGGDEPSLAETAKLAISGALSAIRAPRKGGCSADY